MNKLAQRSVLLIFSLFGLVACSSSNVIPAKFEASVSKFPSINALKLDAVQSLFAITPQLQKSRVVFVGESHTSYSDHLSQLVVIKNLHGKLGKDTSIGIEMIQQKYQSNLL